MKKTYFTLNGLVPRYLRIRSTNIDNVSKYIFEYSIDSDFDTSVYEEISMRKIMNSYNNQYYTLRNKVHKIKGKNIFTKDDYIFTDGSQILFLFGKIIYSNESFITRDLNAIIVDKDFYSTPRIPRFITSLLNKITQEMSIIVVEQLENKIASESKELYGNFINCLPLHVNYE